MKERAKLRRMWEYNPQTHTPEASYKEEVVGYTMDDSDRNQVVLDILRGTMTPEDAKSRFILASVNSIYTWIIAVFIGARILKLKKRIDVGAPTIDSVLPAILEDLDYRYFTERVSSDTWLYVMLPYHRCLSIKLKPEMDMTILTDIADKIRVVDEALKKMGNIYLKVKNYGMT